MRVLLGALLILDGIGTALRLAALLPALGLLPPVATILITCRAGVGGLALVSGWLLLGRRSTASMLARFALLLSAVFATLEAGADLAPSAVGGSMRWTYVIASWVYAGLWIWWLRARRPMS